MDGKAARLQTSPERKPNGNDSSRSCDSEITCRWTQLDKYPQPPGLWHWSRE